MQRLDSGIEISEAARCSLHSACSTIGTTAFCKIDGFDGRVPVEVEPQPARRETPIATSPASGRAIAPTRSLKLNWAERRNC